MILQEPEGLIYIYIYRETREHDIKEKHEIEGEHNIKGTNSEVYLLTGRLRTSVALMMNGSFVADTCGCDGA